MRIVALAAGLSPAMAQFGDDVAFLKRHKEVVVLSDASGKAQVAVVPAWQGRVMTSTDGGVAGASYGWINRELIASGKLTPHMNAFGGEDRFWMGPEGGQFSIFFAKGAAFDFEHWQTPAAIDTEAYAVAEKSQSRVRFKKRLALTNYSGTKFDVALDREIRLIGPGELWDSIDAGPVDGLTAVGYESINRVTNAGKAAWTEATGLLSVWILGMYNAAPSTTVVIPLTPDGQGAEGVTDDYFGKVPADRLKVHGGIVFFRADGKYRSKIGVSPARVMPVLGSYDAQAGVLTIVQYTRPEGTAKYVNSQWKLQDDPFAGDVVNSYSDDGKMGAFYELETSSPAAALKPGETLEHVHRTVHLRGEKADLNRVARVMFGVGIAEIESALE